MAYKQDIWTVQELILLRDNYPTLGDKIPGLNRSPSAIVNRAYRLKIRRLLYTTWTASELDILRREFPIHGADIPELKHRTRHAIATRACTLRTGRRTTSRTTSRRTEPPAIGADDFQTAMDAITPVADQPKPVWMLDNRTAQT